MMILMLLAKGSMKELPIEKPIRFSSIYWELNGSNGLFQTL